MSKGRRGITPQHDNDPLAQKLIHQGTEDEIEAYRGLQNYDASENHLYLQVVFYR